MNGPMRVAAAFVLAALMTPQSSAWEVDMDDARMMAKCLWGECRGIESEMEQAAVAWTILNRVDDDRYPDTIKEVIGQPSQFTGYHAGNPVDNDLLLLSMDVICRWMLERDGLAEVGRVLPKEYVYFVGRNGRNYFGYEWPLTETWDWSAEDPYADPEPVEIITEEETDEHDELSEYMRTRQIDRAPADPGRTDTRNDRPSRRPGGVRRW